MRKIFLWSGLILLIVGSVLAWRAAHPPLSDAQQIALHIEEIQEAANARSSRGILSHLSDDFQFGSMSRSELGKNLSGAFFQWRSVNLRVSGVKTTLNGEQALSEGHYSVEMRQEATSTPDVAKGDFKAWWQKEDGVWKIWKAEGTNIPN